MGALVQGSGGRPVQLVYQRQGRQYTARLTPQKSLSDSRWHLGLWVRDSSAGIGTVTYYEPATGDFGALGHGVGEGGGLPLTQKDADSRALQLDSATELAAVKTLPAEEAERLGVSESAPVAETAQRYYVALLQSRLRTLFECKKQNVYIETQAAFITVYKASAEHALVLSAGGYDVAGKRMENDLAVDGGWVQRKNPDFIVKFVAASALNGDTLGELLARDGLRETAAAKNGRALLLCESMTDAPQLQTAAALCLAKAMYPDLFADIDAAQAVGQLADEAGAQIGGLWFYPAI